MDCWAVNNAVVAQPQLSRVIGEDRNDRELVFPPTYYPGSSVCRRCAGCVDCGMGRSEPGSSARTGAGRAYQWPSRSARWRAKPEHDRAPQEPGKARCILELAPNASLHMDLVDGTFVFQPLQPGDYIIETDDRHLTRPEGRVTLPITVAQGDDINDLVLTVVHCKRSSR